jgi:hypothetical protein
MTTNSFSLPIDVPWYLVAASPDMMATSFCNDPGDDADAYPPAWHSSLAIYAYEPSPSNLPAELCNQKITYLKVTCSITGFQPTAEESSVLAGPPYNFASPYPNPAPFELAFPNTPGGSDIDNALDFGDFTNSYFACYGVLLNVKVLPSVTTVPQATAGSPNTITFTQTGSISNPFLAAPDGTTFTLTRAGTLLPWIALGPVPGSRSRGIQLGGGQTLEIDLPLSTNISIAMYAKGGKRAIGTVTAYEFATQTYTGPLTTGAAGGLTQFQIPNASATRLVIGVSTADVSFVSVTYSSLERATTLSDYPHIIDFEPKTRDLYQSATDQSELLTGSSGSINTGKSLTNTSSSQMGLGLSTTVGANLYGVSFGGTGSLTGSWGNTTSDTSTTQIDSSREARETQGSTTNITQQYNLLTGYHAGTNRAAFLILPRPHTLQATDFRTFVRGLRMIEGVQEFFLIVSRPLDLPGICVEATLETGHFPELIQHAPAPSISQTFSSIASYPVHADGGAPPIGIGQHVTVTYSFAVPPGWSLDTTVTSVAAPQIFLLPGLSYSITPISGETPSSYEYLQAVGSSSVTAGISGGTVSVTISIAGSGQTGGVTVNGVSVPGDTGADGQFNFTLYCTQPVPAPIDNEPVVVTPFLVTSRDLCMCINSCPVDNCVMIAPTNQVPYGQSPGPVLSSSGSAVAAAGTDAAARAAPAAGAPAGAAAAAGGGGARMPLRPGAAPSALASRVAQGVRLAMQRRSATATQSAPHGPQGRSSVVYESKIRISPELLKPEHLKKSRTPAAREVMYQIQHHMLNSWRLPHRRPARTVGYLDSDFVAQRLMKALSRRYLARPVADVGSLPRAAVRNLGRKITVGTVLAMELHRLRQLAKVSLEEAVAIRRMLLGLPDLQNRNAHAGPERQAPVGGAGLRQLPAGPAERAGKQGRRRTAPRGRKARR